MKYLYILFFFLPFFALNQNSKLVKGNLKYSQLAYLEAIDSYEHFLSKKGDSSVVAANLGQSYLKVGNTNKALAWYNFMSKKEMLDRVQHLDYALLKRQTNDYQGSVLTLHGYESKFGSNDVSQRLLLENESLIEQLDYEHNFIIKKDPINTTASDIGVSFINDTTVLVTSAKRFSSMSDKRYAWNNTNFYSVCVSKVTADNDLGPYSLLKGDVNTSYHDGPATLDTVNNWLYFTRDNYIAGKLRADTNKTTRLKIYRGKYNNQKVTEVEELHFNNDNYSCGHPTLNADGSKMFFVSDKPGGFGGTDLYYVDIDSSGIVGEPVNMGEKVNSSLNEMFPYYHSADNLLFFSSNGLPGYGGLDIFIAKLNTNYEINSVSNIGTGINSPEDDFSFITNSTQTNGFFCSNRGLDIGDDDIYSFKQLKKIGNNPHVSGYILDEISGLPIPYSPVYLIANNDTINKVIANGQGFFEMPLDSINSDFYLYSTPTNLGSKLRHVFFEADKMAYKEDILFSNYYRLVGVILDRNTNKPIDNVSIAVSETEGSRYENKFTSNLEGGFETDKITTFKEGDELVFKLTLKKPGYVTESYEFNTKLTKDSIIDITAFLNLRLTEIKIGETDLASIININPIYFDFDKYNIRPDAAIELDKIIQVMNDNPGIKIELGSHTDTRGSDEYNMVLSDNRAKSSAAYIINKGIPKDRIYGKGYGETKLKVTDKVINAKKTKEEREVLHQLNRRTEFIIVGVDASVDSDIELINPTTIKKKVATGLIKPVTTERTVANVYEESINSSEDDEKINLEVSEKTVKQSSTDNSKIVHVVAEKENLYRISLKTGVSVDEIKRLNNLNSDVIRVGQTLKIN